MTAVSGFDALARQVGLQLPTEVHFPRPVVDVSVEFDAHIKAGELAGYKPIPTGFAQLDAYLGGVFIPESLIVLGGAPGVGKTVFALQAARNIAAMQRGVIALVVCFEHSEGYLYHRLLCMESRVGSANGNGVTMNDIRGAALGHDHAEAGLATLLATLPAANEAFGRMVGYWERLFLVKGHPAKTTTRVLDIYLTTMRQRFPNIVLFVDYLQKIPVFMPGVEITTERQIRYVTEALKDLTLKHKIPILAVAASESEGLKGARVRFEDLFGGESVKYEPDVALMLNPTFGDESRRRQRGKQVIFSIEKNRMGPTGVEFIHTLHGENFAFETREARRPYAPIAVN